MNRFIASISTAFLICFAVGLGPGVASAQGQAASQSSSGSSTAAKPPVHHTAATHTGTNPALLHPATLHAKAPDEFQVKFTTTKGDFVMEVTRSWAPNGADRFYNLVKHGFFTGVSFYRVVPNFVVQFGVSPDPKVTAAWNNATIKDDPVKQSNKPGFVTFAQTGEPNSRTTQVFVNLGDNSSLDGQNFAPFGQITSGLDVIQKFYSGYGDLPEMGGKGPSQDRMGRGGKAYLDANFPNLDSIKSATIISQTPPPAAPAKKPAAPNATKKPAASSSSSQ